MTCGFFLNWTFPTYSSILFTIIFGTMGGPGRNDLECAWADFLVTGITNG